MNEFLDLYSDYAVIIFFSGFVFAVFVDLIGDAVSALDDLFFYRHQVARCEAILSGEIDGPCHCRRCIYSVRCPHYVRRSNLFIFLRNVLKKNKPRN